ncbi:MAG TPA: hypothetical protein VM282_13590 [Acidimicrobiales bacterium]|nr:hypothetical protein [Acidimicrobiales bacterium]
MRVGSFDEWWARTSALAGPLARLLAALPAEAADAIRLDARQSVRAYETADGLEFPGVTLLATARRQRASRSCPGQTAVRCRGW